jgi:hypothetical protein
VAFTTRSASADPTGCRFLVKTPGRQTDHFKEEVMKLFNGFNVGSLAIGAGVVLLAPVIIPVVGSILKPLTKAIIKGGLLAYEGAKVSIAETKETFEDIAAEAKAEIAHGGEGK